MASEYSLADVLERFYQNQLALKATLMELPFWGEWQNAPELGENDRGALHTISENAGHIKQGLTRLKTSDFRYLAATRFPAVSYSLAVGALPSRKNAPILFLVTFLR